MSSITRALGAASVLALAATASLAAPLAAPLAAQSAPQKFAYVNSQRILEQAPGRADAEAQMQKEFKAMEAVVKRMEDSLQLMIDAFDRVQGTLTVAAKDQRLRALDAKRNEYGQRTQDLQTKLQQRQGELMQPILDQIKIVLEDLRVEGGYTMLFDVGQQGSAIVAVDKNLDLSDRVLAKLRTMPKPVIAEAKTEAARPAPPAPAGAPLSAPAGVRPPGTNPPALGPGAAGGTTKKMDDTSKKAADTARKADTTTKKPDSTAKKPDSTTKKKPDSTTKRPDAMAASPYPFGA